jgi:predicted lysophospholipase L1 biosynthesis ABC-type transport system permease subunit
VRNLANLLLARATVRQREFGIRLALGASRGRVIRQLLAESLLLAGLGGGFGVLLAVRMTDFLRVFIPATHLPVVLNFPVDSSALAFTLLISVSAGLIFGLAPAMQTVGFEPLASLKESGRGSTSWHAVASSAWNLGHLRSCAGVAGAGRRGSFSQQLSSCEADRSGIQSFKRAARRIESFRTRIRSRTGKTFSASLA